MNIAPHRWRVRALGLLLLTGLCACIAVGPGYDGGVGVGYVGGYTEPYGFDYGGWGPGYHVAPPRGGERHPAQSASHAYRPAPSSRPTPSIPSRPRGR